MIAYPDVLKEAAGGLRCITCINASILQLEGDNGHMRCEVLGDINPGIFQEFNLPLAAYRRAAGVDIFPPD